MKKSTSTKSIWSQKDLQEYLAEAVNAYKVGRDWPTVLNMLIKGGGEDDSEQPEIPHPASSLAVTRRIQVVREYLSDIPRRRLVDGTKGNTIIPFKAILHTVSGILQTPLIKDDVVSLGSQGSATSPQAKQGYGSKAYRRRFHRGRWNDRKYPRCHQGAPCSGRRRVPRSRKFSNLSAGHWSG